MLKWIKQKISDLFEKKKKIEIEEKVFLQASVSSNRHLNPSNYWLDNYSPYRPYYPNSGDLDSRVSTIATGRPLKNVLI